MSEDGYNETVDKGGETVADLDGTAMSLQQACLLGEDSPELADFSITECLTSSSDEASQGRPSPHKTTTSTLVTDVTEPSEQEQNKALPV